MHSRFEYTPPSTEDLQRLKDDLGYTGEEMAVLAGIAGSNQWRKYTGGAEPREVSLQMLFFIAARLELDPDAFEAVLQRMNAIGARVVEHH